MQHLYGQFSEEDRLFYEENGYVHLPNFLTPSEVNALKEDITQILSQAVLPKVIEPHVKLMGTKYHLDSVDKSSLFFESACVQDGMLTAPLNQSVHKIGHGCHVQCEGAKAVTFSEKMKNAIKLLTGFSHPSVVQGMFLLKQAKIGECSPIHIDETYLIVEPVGNVSGVWIALDDSLEHNGCLEFLPGSHKGRTVNKRWIREEESHRPGTEWKSIMKHVSSEDVVEEINENDFVKVPVKSGGLLLIHGLVLHRSSPNTSDDTRYAFTFHVYDNSRQIKWSKLNWAQETEEFKFPSLY